MKRNECTVESLKRLGYEARSNFKNSWRFLNCEKVLQGERAEEVFNAIVHITRNGGKVEVRRNNLTYEVNVFVDCFRKEFRGTETVYYLSRPMTEQERLEADLYTGRNR